MWSRFVHCFTAVVRLSNSNMILSSVMLNSLHFEPSRYKVSLHKLLLVLQWILFHIGLPIIKFLFVSWQVSYNLLARVISCDPFGYQLSQTCGGHRVICSLFQNSTFTYKFLRHVTLKLMLCFMHVPITHHLIYLYLNCIVFSCLQELVLLLLEFDPSCFFPQAVWSNLIVSLKPHINLHDLRRGAVFTFCSLSLKIYVEHEWNKINIRSSCLH